MDTDVSRDVLDRTSGLEHQSHGALSQLVGILPRCRHSRSLALCQDRTWLQGLRQTQRGSVQTFTECLFYGPVTSPHVGGVSLYAATQTPKYAINLFTQTAVNRLATNDASPGSVDVTAGATTKTYNAVIVTPSTWALQMSCDFDFPATMLPIETKQSIDASHWISSTKIFYPLKERYWEVSSIPQVINTDTFLQDVYGYAVGDNDPGVLLLSYTWEDDANKLDGADDDSALAAKCLAKLDEITTVGTGKAISDYVDTTKPLVFRWSRQPTYRGCAKLYRERSWAMDYALLGHNQENGGASGLYFAGEGYSVEGGWTEPALRLALDSVIHLINDRGGKFLNEFQYSLYPRYDVSFQPV